MNFVKQTTQQEEVLRVPVYVVINTDGNVIGVYTDLKFAIRQKKNWGAAKVEALITND